MALYNGTGSKKSYKVLRDFANLAKSEERCKRDFDALQDLHNEFGFDFTKQIFARIIEGKFTQNSISKEFDIDFSKNMVVVVSLADNWRRFYVCRLTGTSVILSPGNAFSSCLSSFYTKSDFEEYRKKAVKTLIIAQENANLTETRKRYRDTYKNDPTDLLQRFYYWDEKQKDYGIIMRDKKRLWDNKIMGRSVYGYNYFCPVLDKSGYILNIKQDDLKRKAKTLKAEKDKARYNEMTNINDMILKCENAIRVKRDVIADLMKIAETPEEISTIIDKLSKWSGLGSCIDDISRIKRKVKEGGFASPENFNKAISEIYQTLEKL